MSEYTVTFQVGDAPPKTLTMPVEAVLTITAEQWSVSQEATFVEEPDYRHLPDEATVEYWRGRYQAAARLLMSESARVGRLLNGETDDPRD